VHIQLNRLKKLVREHEERRREEGLEHEKHMAMVSGCILAHSPGLRLVEPCDTDEGTYARIQEVIAESERRTKDAKRWRRVYEPVPPSKYAGKTPEDFRDYFNASMADIPERCEREKLAVEAAKKRLGINDTDKRYDPPPGPME